MLGARTMHTCLPLRSHTSCGRPSQLRVSLHIHCCLLELAVAVEWSVIAAPGCPQLGRLRTTPGRRHRWPPASCTRSRAPAQGGDGTLPHAEDQPVVSDGQPPSSPEPAASGQSARAAAGTAGSRGATLFEAAAAAASAGEGFFGGGAADAGWLAPAEGAPGPSWWEDLAPPAEVGPLHWHGRTWGHCCGLSVVGIGTKTCCPSSIYMPDRP